GVRVASGTNEKSRGADSGARLALPNQCGASFLLSTRIGCACRIIFWRNRKIARRSNGLVQLFYIAKVDAFGQRFCDLWSRGFGILYMRKGGTTSGAAVRNPGNGSREPRGYAGSGTPRIAFF